MGGFMHTVAKHRKCSVYGVLVLAKCHFFFKGVNVKENKQPDFKQTLQSVNVAAECKSVATCLSFYWRLLMGRYRRNVSNYKQNDGLNIAASCHSNCEIITFPIMLHPGLKLHRKVRRAKHNTTNISNGVVRASARVTANWITWKFRAHFCVSFDKQNSKNWRPPPLPPSKYRQPLHQFYSNYSKNPWHNRVGTSYETFLLRNGLGWKNRKSLSHRVRRTFYSRKSAIFSFVCLQKRPMNTG